jgi:hypothetical protein
MSASEDIRNLFGKFEGQAQHYQEVSRENQAGEARTRWPLLSSIALDESDRVPDVGDHGARVTEVRPPPPAPPQGQALRETAPAFRIQNAAARMAAAAEAAVFEAQVPHDSGAPDMPPLLRARSVAPIAPAVPYPPVVTPETSTRHSPHARDFAPAVVPVNHFAPGSLMAPVSATPLAATLMNAAPMRSTPMRPAAASANPMSSTPTGPAAVSASPMRSTPTGPAAVSVNPMRSTPTSSPAVSASPMNATPRQSILGRMFAPTPVDETPAPAAGDDRAGAKGDSRDLQAVFSRLSGAQDRRRIV